MNFLDEDTNLPVRKQNTMWLTSLADLLALLLAFFVLVFAMNEIKRDTWETVVDALGNPLNFINKIQEVGPTAEKNVELFSEQRAFNLAYLENILSAKIASTKQLETVEVFKAADRLVISFAGDTFFEAGNKAASDKLVDATRLLGESLRYVKNRVEVYGHTDPIKVSNPSADTLSNWGLSLARALSVSEALERAGYSFPIRVFGMADTRFFELSKNQNKDEKYALARRVDIVIREAKGQGR